uniref:Uncharacterized protein n=1 Tax=Chromera velia CCMP2878 TaxID=1169474 RepID=A0A0G4HRZ3_9ALVE|eukprot:Cvel_8172.t1-p1 / transcript=Cvel_8172.t1 / gene=Cvel_8172 / organism=Chromera_velia_CCMP2878 / gene_product=hypothetical protein / transcript_product=hypothetical protein / location=Cvel_scaffold445:52850-53455(-) / protein_length=202 / sequence_SO=supercontig / SO=protein_coding / is_pseudo=false
MASESDRYTAFEEDQKEMQKGTERSFGPTCLALKSRPPSLLSSLSPDLTSAQYPLLSFSLHYAALDLFPVRRGSRVGVAPRSRDFPPLLTMQGGRDRRSPDALCGGVHCLADVSVRLVAKGQVHALTHRLCAQQRHVILWTLGSRVLIFQGSGQVELWCMIITSETPERGSSATAAGSEVMLHPSASSCLPVLLTPFLYACL